MPQSTPTESLQTDDQVWISEFEQELQFYEKLLPSLT